VAVVTASSRACGPLSSCTYRRAIFSRLLLTLLLLPFASCRKKESTPPDVHAITAQLVQSARKATGDAAEIRVFPARALIRAGGQEELSPERLFIRLTDSSGLAALENDWQNLGRSQGLDLKRVIVDSRLVRYEYRFDGRITHSMQVLLPGARRGERGSLPPGPRLALVIDDLGYELPSAERLFALPFRMTAAVLPNHPLSARLAERASQRGFEVLLHFPMESAGGEEKAEGAELRTGMTPQETSRMLEEMLASVPHAAGVSNHQGSRATADPALMRTLVAALRARRLFLVDSRTSPDSVAYNTARAAGLPATYRTVFLDDVAAPGAIAAQLALAERQAREHGWALAIGHPYRVTLDVLEEALPGIEARGVRLVYASEVVE
jgi:polysaccharide deacetylase 2 family uncharacterized protein YibQ